MPKFSKKQSLRKNRYSGGSGSQSKTNTKKTSQKTKTAATFIGAAAVIGSAMMGKRPNGKVPHRVVVADHKEGWTCEDYYELGKIPEDATCVGTNRGYKVSGRTHGTGVTIRYTNVTPKHKEVLLKQRRTQVEKAQKARENSQIRNSQKKSKSKKR
jgi:hypothetical protein